MNDESQPAKEAVLRFAQAWTSWETQMAKKGNDSLHDPVMKEAHAALIRDHCTAKKRAYVDGLPTYGQPPTYADVVASNIIKTELYAPNKAHVDARCTQMLYRFVVHKKRDGWRIEGIKWKIGDADEWINGLIGM
jgi:hypothetical protein